MVLSEKSEIKILKHKLKDLITILQGNREYYALENTLMASVLEFAKARDKYDEYKRKVIFKVYRKMKYGNKALDEKETQPKKKLIKEPSNGIEQNNQDSLSKKAKKKMQKIIKKDFQKLVAKGKETDSPSPKENRSSSPSDGAYSPMSPIKVSSPKQVYSKSKPTVDLLHSPLSKVHPFDMSESSKQLLSKKRKNSKDFIGEESSQSLNLNEKNKNFSNSPGLNSSAKKKVRKVSFKLNKNEFNGKMVLKI